MLCGVCGVHGISVDIRGYPWISVGVLPRGCYIRGISVHVRGAVAVDIRGYPWISVGIRGYPWIKLFGANLAKWTDHGSTHNFGACLSKSNRFWHAHQGLNDGLHRLHQICTVCEVCAPVPTGFGWNCGNIDGIESLWLCLCLIGKKN